MDEITKIAYNCRKATFLIEKQQIDSITPREKIELKIHLAGCKICRIFEQQSVTINKMVHDLLRNNQHKELTMSDIFKKSMKEKIELRLNGGTN
jgi:hypothetical protein